LGESPSISQVVGACLVLLGILMIEKKFAAPA